MRSHASTKTILALYLGLAASQTLAQAPNPTPSTPQAHMTKATPNHSTLNQTTKAMPLANNPNIAAQDALDPRQYMEEIEGEAALNWATQHNQSSLARLSSDPRFETFRQEALNIVSAKDRIAAPSFAKGGMVDNFWQDSDHVRGIWRRSDWVSYAKGTPDWQTILDIDALSKAEGKNWVYKGSSCLMPDKNICLISLSNGGKDAVTIREFNIATKSFVEGGFDIPDGKQSAVWVDKDTLYISREWTPGEVTTSGYAYVTKRLRRGQGLDQAVEVYRGKTSDVSANLSVLRDIDGKYIMDMAIASPSFFETITQFMTPKGAVELPLPLTTSFDAYYKGQAVFTLKNDWTSAKGTLFASGSIIALNLDAALNNPTMIEPALVFAPNSHQSVEAISVTRNHLIVALMSDVKGEIRAYTVSKNVWTSRILDLPANSTLSIGSSDDRSDSVFAYATGFLQPSTLYRVDASSGEVTLIKSSPKRFDETGLEVKQLWATSKDGTKVPYFLVSRKDAKRDGNTATIIYAYGGFEISQKPNYSGSLGKLWLEKGGAYVLANIRGGGEFGPKWHEAGLKTNRQRIYDDFQAVALDLIDKKITSPRRLGIMGGSNGGLLMGVQFTQRPDLWNAVVIQVPLLDMVRISKIGAGASWQGEYGDPNIAAESAFLRSISPYHNVKAGVSYPEPLIETSTKDDRVHPAHARKFAALLDDMGLPFYYYENIDGGHAAAANLSQTARRYAIEYTYLSRKLMD